MRLPSPTCTIIFPDSWRIEHVLDSLTCSWFIGSVNRLRVYAKHWALEIWL